MTTKNAKKSKVDTASNDAFISYGLKPPLEEPDVGTLYTISDDPADPVLQHVLHVTKSNALKRSTSTTIDPKQRKLEPNQNLALRQPMYFVRTGRV